MTFLPIAERELCVASRRPATYWGRFITGLVAVVFCGFVLVMIHFTGGRGFRGRDLFTGFSSVALMYCMFAGVSRTSDCLSVEKRDGTLGFLFLTSLRGYDIVLGKLAAALVETLQGLLAAMPVLAVVLLLGGVRLVELALVGLALLNALWFAGSLGMMVSTFSRNQQHAGLLAVTLAVFFLWMSMGVAEAINAFWPGHWLAPLLTALNPGHQISAAMGVAALRYGVGYWENWLALHAASWACLGVSAWALPRSWQEKPARRGRNLTLRERVRQWAYGTGERRAEHRRKLLDQNPFLWLASRDRLAPARVWLMLGLTAVIPVGLTAALSRDLTATAITGVIVVAAWCLLIMLGAGTAASSRLAEERIGGTLEFLLSTPMPVSEIARGIWLTINRLYFWPAVVTGALVLLSTVAIAGRMWREPDEAFAVLAIGGGLFAMFAASLAALGWTGMWVGISAKDARQASGNAIVHILGLPVLLFMFWSGFVALVCFWAGLRPFDWPFYFVSWFVIGMANNAVHFIGCRHLFHTRIRQLAASRYEQREALTFWGRLGRWLGRRMKAT